MILYQYFGGTMKYFFVALIASSFTSYTMDNKTIYQFNSQDKSKRFPITDKKIMNGKFQTQNSISICEALKLPINPSPDQIKARFFSRYNRLKAIKDLTHRDVKLLKLMGIEHRLLDEDGEAIEYGEPIILSDEELDISKDEAIEHIEANQTPQRPTIIQLEQHNTQYPGWLNYVPAFIRLAYAQLALNE